jgi:phosphonate transport system substrate-binding protein
MLNFGFMPYSDPDHMRALHNAVTSYLGAELKLRFRFILAPDYHTMGRLMDRGMVDLAWFTPASYARVGRRVGASAFCKPFRRGRATYRPIIVAREGYRAGTLLDLKGARFAYVDRHSTSGFIVPNEMLRHVGVAEPLDFFSEVQFTFSHAASLRGLREGRYDAAAVYEGAPEDLAQQLGPGAFRTVATGPEVPNDPIAVRRGFDPALLARLRDLMLGMEKHPLGRESLARLERLESISRFVAASDRDYVRQ